MDRLVSHTLIYIVGSVIGPAIPFLLLPIMTRYLSPSDYGILSILTAFQSFSLYLISFNQHSSYTRFYYQYPEKKSQSLMINCLLIITGVFAVLLTFLWVTGNFYKNIILVNKSWIYIVLFIAYFSALELLLKTHMQMKKRPIPYVLISFGSAAFVAFITVYFVIIKGQKWEGKIYALIIYYIVFSIVFFLYLCFGKQFNLKPKLNISLESIKFGAGLIIGTIAIWGINLMDRFFISSYGSMDDLGKYTVGFQYGYIVFILIAALGKAWGPYFWENFLRNGKDGKELIIIYSKYILIVVILLTSLVIIIGPVILKLMVDEQYYGAEKYLKWIAAGYGIQGLQIIFIQYIVLHKKTLFLSIVSIVTLTLKMFISYFLINEFGAIGAAWSTCISFIIPTTAIIIYSKVLEPIHISKLLSFN